MKNRIGKIFVMLFIVVTITAFFTFKTNALDLGYSGSSISNNTGATATTSGFSVTYTAAKDNICGYRFSIVSSDGLPKSGTKVVNVYLSNVSIGSTSYSSGQRFIVSNDVLANKKQLANGTKVYSTTSKQGCDYSSGSCGFYSTLPQDPSSVGNWIKTTSNSYQNLQRIYVLCGTNILNATGGDYVLIEPIFWVKLANVRTAATATELAIYGASVSGGDGYKGTDGNLYNAGSTTLWNLSNYINREFPNALYVSSSTDVYSGVSASSSGKYTYKQIIENGYGCSVLTVKNVITIKKVNITYNVNGGTLSSATYSINENGYISNGSSLYFQYGYYGSKINPYDTSTFGLKRIGYTFTGWKVRSTGTVLDQSTDYDSTYYAQYDNSSKTTANTQTVYCYLDAQWTPNKVYITYNVNGGILNSTTYTVNQHGHIFDGSEYYFQYGYYGSNINPYDASTFSLTKTGYKFAGWKVSSTGVTLDQSTDYDSTYYAQYDNSSKTTANTETVYCYLTAQWTPNKVYITYNVNGGTLNSTTYTVNQHGHIFDGSEYYFQYGYYGSDINPYNASTFGMSRNGYDFVGWRVESTGTILDQNTDYSSTYYAQYNNSLKTTANTYEVYCYLYAIWEKSEYANGISHWAWGFNGNGNNVNKNGFHLADTTYTKKYGDIFSLDVLNSHIIPNGFYLDEVFGTDSIANSWEHYPFGTSITQNAGVMWFEYDYYPINYNITYNLNGGINNNNPNTYNVLYGVSLNEPSKDNVEFLGWELKIKKDIIITATDNNWNYKEIIYHIKPGITYNISIESAKLTSGKGTDFSCIIYDFTSNNTLDRKQISFGNNVNFTLSCPSNIDSSHDIVLLIYAGVNGSTSGNAVTYKNLSVTFEADGINKDCGSTFESVDDFYYQVQRRITGDVEFTANWEEEDTIGLTILPIDPNAPYRENTEVITSF